MSDYDNTNRGTLFRNTRREKDTHPEYNGSINIEGVDYWLSGWVKEGRNGKFFSLSVRPKEVKTDESVQRVKDSVEQHFPSRPSGLPEKPRGGGPLPDDDIPFAPEVR